MYFIHSDFIFAEMPWRKKKEIGSAEGDVFAACFMSYAYNQL